MGDIPCELMILVFSVMLRLAFLKGMWGKVLVHRKIKEFRKMVRDHNGIGLMSRHREELRNKRRNLLELARQGEVKCGGTGYNEEKKWFSANVGKCAGLGMR